MDTLENLIKDMKTDSGQSALFLPRHHRFHTEVDASTPLRFRIPDVEEKVFFFRKLLDLPGSVKLQSYSFSLPAYSKHTMAYSPQIRI